MEFKSIYMCIAQTVSKMHVLRAVWNMCHPESYSRLALSAVLKNVPFWNMLQIGNVQTSSYRSCMLKARSWSIKTCARKSKLRPSYYICLFVCFSVMIMNVELLFKFTDLKRHHCFLPSILQSLHSANLKHVSKWHFFFFRTTHNANLKYVSGWHMLQNGTQHTHCYFGLKKKI